MELKDLRDDREPFFICIGYPEHVYDSVAPRVGTMLKKAGYKVLGTMESPLHALNIKESEQIINKYKSSFHVIALDAVITANNYLYRIKKEPCKPGAGVKKELPMIGESTIMINPFYGKNHTLLKRKTKVCFPFFQSQDLASIEVISKNVFNDIRRIWRSDKNDSKVVCTDQNT